MYKFFSYFQNTKYEALPDSAEFDAEGLHLDEQFAHVYDLVPDQGLEEDADKPHQSVLHVLVLDGLAGGDAVGYIEMDELGGELHRRGEPVHHLHAVQTHLHVDQHREVLCDLAGAALHQL